MNGSRPPSWRARIAAQPVLLVLLAIVVRLVVFTSRGDYVAFDEGWYLLLGRGIYDGTGFRLSGLQHTTLSPLFPILAGAVGVVIDNAVWAGRIVAAICAGLLVWPCWSIFKRLAGERVAWIGCILVIFMPALTPFAAPYWIGWDLWVGAEPVMQLMLFGAIALTLRARATGRALDWIAGGVLFALAYLARPESILFFALVGGVAGAVTLIRRQPRQTGYALLMATAFALTALPYWVYLHGALGRWALTGRYVEVPSARAGGAGAETSDQPRGSASGIERMLWQNENRQYVRELYGLDASGTRLRSTYWGIPVAAPADVAPTDEAMLVEEESAAPGTTPGAQAVPPEPPSRWMLYARSLGILVPWFIWPLAFLGLVGRRRALEDELLFALPIVATSLLIARVVGADPRTQLFILPLVVLYAARGLVVVGDVADSKLRGTELRAGFVTNLLTGLTVLGLVVIVGNWVWMGHEVGSRHHHIGAANRAVGAQLARIVPSDEPVMSWHPAVALYADRPWRVLPYAPLPAIVHYARVTGTSYIVLSRFFPGSRMMEGIEPDHLVLRIDPSVAPTGTSWNIEVVEQSPVHALGELRYTAAPGGEP